MARKPTMRYDKNSIWGLALTSLLVVGLWLYIVSRIPAPIFDDWTVFYHAAQAAGRGESPYTLIFEGLGFFNPPWVAWVLLPFTWFGVLYGGALLALASMAGVVAICHKYRFSGVKVFLVLMSPMMIDILIHGQIDALVAAGMLLPAAWWPVVAVAKPPAALALGLGAIKKDRLVPAIGVSLAVLAVSVLLHGWWPLEVWGLLGQTSVTEADWNLLQNIWPLTIPLGAWLAWRGWQRNDPLYLLAGSPFLLPYAAYHSFIGLALLLIRETKDWQAAVLVGAAWVSWILA